MTDYVDSVIANAAENIRLNSCTATAGSTLPLAMCLVFVSVCVCVSVSVSRVIPLFHFPFSSAVYVWVLTSSVACKLDWRHVIADTSAVPTIDAEVVGGDGPDATYSTILAADVIYGLVSVICIFASKEKSRVC